MTTQSTLPEKNVYVVLGMARSGTSAIARALSALGVSLGDELIAAREKWNPKGFFEDNDIVYKVNRRVLDTLNQSWVGAKLIDPACYQQVRLQPLKKLATKLLKKRMHDTQNWGFKDPRTAKLLPFWQPLFQELHLNEHYIIALRNPLDSAHSYLRVNGVDVEVGLLLWVMHLIPAIENTQGKQRIIVSYDAMMKDTHAQLERMKQHLGLSLSAQHADVDSYANEFLDKKLRHYASSDDEFKSHPAVAVVPICVKIYELLLQVAKDQIDFEGEIFSSQWSALKAEFACEYPLYCYMDTLLNKNKSLERQLRTIRKSWPWKLLYPLRLIDDALRVQRKKRREKQRLVNVHG